MQVARHNAGNALDIEAGGDECLTCRARIGICIAHLRAGWHCAGLQQHRATRVADMQDVERLQEAGSCIKLARHHRRPRLLGYRAEDRPCIAPEGSDTKQVDCDPPEINAATFSHEAW